MTWFRTSLTQATATDKQESSVEITTDAKGVPKCTVKIYHTDPAIALEQALAHYNALRNVLGIKWTGTQPDAD